MSNTSSTTAHNSLRLLAVTLLASVTCANAVSGTYAYFTDKDSGGGALYGGAPVWVATANACQAACTADPNCYGWTFSIPSVSGWNGPCYLKANENCDANASGKVASGIISNSCTVTCNGKPVTVVSNCAIVTPTPTSTKAAGRFRRDVAEREANELKRRLCPKGLTACPINNNFEGYECVDLSEELESCGACGNDCTQIEGVKDVTCSRGRCRVSSCRRGFHLESSAEGSCSKVPNWSRHRDASHFDTHARRRSGL